MTRDSEKLAPSGPQGCAAGRKLDPTQPRRQPGWGRGQGLWRKRWDLRTTGGEAKGARVRGRARGPLTTAQAHLTWVLMTGHLLVLGIQRPRRPGLFPQLHVWVPVRRGRERRTQFTERQMNSGSTGQGRIGSHLRSSSQWPHGLADKVQGSEYLRDWGGLALAPRQGTDLRTHTIWGEARRLQPPAAAAPFQHMQTRRPVLSRVEAGGGSGRPGKSPRRRDHREPGRWGQGPRQAQVGHAARGATDVGSLQWGLTGQRGWRRHLKCGSL